MPRIRPDVATLLARHGGDAEAALLACLLEIDRLGAAHDRAVQASAYGYSRGRLHRPLDTVTPVASARREVLDV